MAKSKTTAPKTYCFVLMPFSEAFDDIYKLGIKEACTAAGAYCERVDEQIFHERILDRVYNQIAKADIIIADMTGRNPNVFYEVGYAHALGKLTILLTQDANDIPFDLKHFSHIVYGAKVSIVRDDLEKRVRYFIDNPPTKPSDTKLDIDLYLEGQNLAAGAAFYTSRGNSVPGPEITVHNASTETLRSGDFKVGVLTSSRFPYNRNPDTNITKLPDGRYLHMLPDFPDLFPTAYAAYRVYLDTDSGKHLREGEEEIINVRLFTRLGARDYRITLRKAS
jgi:hypothetical protein